MLAGAGAVHLQRPLDHVLDTRLDLFSLLFVPSVVHDALVEVTVTNVSENAGEKAEVVHFLLAHLDDVGQPAERNGDVGAPWIVVR